MIYLSYRSIAMVENSILINVWYTISSDDDLWYHIPAIVYIISSILH